ncbi:hypothetical protein HK097_003913 [Rhizophlyctis rosea]|uniref:Uncharacterized protein n=1 Tax=Rhizophlyctis rosea TaxID=64517 RepID=A0AAD5SMA8_9FUNG|nr:hypothetical protein HK097_003913 [Rhizophlyctis rosea]
MSQTLAPNEHFFKKLPELVLHAILNNHIGEDILLRYDTATYACLCSVDRFFCHNLRLKLKRSLLIVQASREEQMLSLYKNPENANKYVFDLRSISLMMRLVNNPYFDPNTYLSGFLSTYRQEPNDVFFFASCFHIMAPRQESLEYQPHPALKCLFLKTVSVDGETEHDGQEAGAAESWRYACVFINGDFRPNLAESRDGPGYVVDYMKVFKSSAGPQAARLSTNFDVKVELHEGNL